MSRMSCVRGVFAILLLAAVGTSCRSPQVDVGDVTRQAVPPSFTAAGSEDEVRDRWWLALGSGELNGLIDRALAGNTTLEQSVARLSQARALATQRGAARWPSVDLQGGFSVSERGDPLIPGGDTRSESAELGVAASYEVDLWGRVSAQVDQAELEWQASYEDLRAARISVVAEATLAYLDLMAVRQTLDTVDEQLATSRQVEELVELRYRRSQATALDVLQQQENVAAVEALIPPLKAREQLRLHALTVLCGVPSGRDLELKGRSLPSIATLPSTGLPLELAARRPDVRAMRMRLDAAQLGVRVAEADRLPALRLTASAGYSATEISDLFDNWLARLAGNLVGPLIDAGRRRAEVDRTRAAVDEWVARYRGVLLQSVREVEDALVREQRQVEYIKALEKQLEIARRTRQEAQSRYRRGAESYLSVLSALSNVQRLERQLTDAIFNRVSYRVQLYRALSGGWTESDTEMNGEMPR